MRDKRYVHSIAPTIEAHFFHTNEEYNYYYFVALKLITSLKSWDFQLLKTRALKNLYEILEYYNLTKFVSYNEKCYPGLVRMFYANLEIMFGKLSCYVMNKKIGLDVPTLAKLFEMNGSAPYKLAKDFQEFS